MEQRILVVDDEELVRNYCQKVFEIAGYKTDTASSAEEALQMMDVQPYWVLFLDLGLPGMNGVDLCRHIRENWPMASVFAMTGQVSLFQLSTCREAGFEDYFPKPVSRELLVSAAKTAFDRLSRWRKGEVR